MPENCLHHVKKVTAFEAGYKITCISCGLETKPLAMP